MTAINGNIRINDLDRNDENNQKNRFEEENKKTMNGSHFEKEELIGTELISWKEISETLDRICFCLYALLVVMLIVIFSLILNGVSM